MQFSNCWPSTRRAIRAVIAILVLVLTVVSGWGQGVQRGEKWRFKTGGDIFGAPALSPDGLTLYAGSLDGSLYALDAASGRLNWSYAARLSTDNSIRSSPAVAPDGTILFGSGDWLYALNPNGSLKWTNTTYGFGINISGTVYSSPAITTEGQVIVAGAENRRLFVFDLRSGGLIRSNSFPANFISSAAIGVDNSIFIGGLDGNLYALTSALGNRWVGKTTLGISGGPAIGPDGTIYTGSADNRLYAFGSGGSRLWAFETGDAIFASPVVGLDGTVYVGSWDNKFYAVNPNGTLKWSYTAEGLVHGSAALAADGTIYVPTDVGSAGRLLALSSQGTYRWEFNSGEQFHASPLIGPDGTVYIGSFDDHIFAIPGSSGPAVSSWPMVARTVARPGRVNAQVTITSPRAGRVMTSPANVVVDTTITTAPGGMVLSLELYSGAGLVGRQTFVRPGGLVTFPAVTISEINRHTLQVRASVRNLDGTQDVVASAPISILVIQNRNGPVLSVIPDVETSKQAQVPFSASDAETPPEELLFVVESQSSVIPVENVQIQGTSTNRILIITPVLSAAVPPEGVVVPLSLTVYDGDIGDAATRNAKRTFNVKVLPPTTPPVILLGSPVPPGSNRLVMLEDQVGGSGPVVVNVADEEDDFNELVLTFMSLDPDLIPPLSVSLGGSGFDRSIRFTPAPNQSGLARIALTVRDTSGETATTNLVVSIAPVNDAPVVSPIESFTFNENEASRRVFFSVRDVDTPSTLVTVRAISSNPALLPVSNITFDGTGESRSVTLRPATGQTGVASISLVATDTSSIPPIGSALSTFTVTVNRANTPPTIQPIPQMTTFEDTPIVPVPITISDLESPATSLTVTAVATNEVLVPMSHIRIEGTGTNRTLSLFPATNLFGTNLIVVTVTDPQGASNRVFFQLVVTPLNDLPQISPVLPVVMDEDSVSPAAGFTVSDLETAAEALTVTASSSNPGLISNGGITVASAGKGQRTVTLRPAADANGTATVTLTVQDGEASASTSFLLTVRPVNDAPTIAAPGGTLTVTENQTFTLPAVTGADVDAGSGVLRWTLAAVPGLLDLAGTTGLTFENGLPGSGSFQAIGTLADLNAAMRAIRYTPPAGFSGPASISMILTDQGNTGSGVSRSGTAGVSLRVAAGNRPPTISTIAKVRIDVNKSSAPIAFTVGDAETAPELLGVTLSSSNPALLPTSRIELLGDAASRSLLLIPVRDRTGTATLEVTVTDAEGATAVARFNVVVESLNRPPLLGLPAVIRTGEDAPGGSGPIPFLADDPDTSIASLSLTVTSADTRLLAAGGIVLGGSGTNRTLTLTPRPDEFGTTVVSVVLSDGALAVTNSLRFEVAPSNDLPRVVAAATASTREDGTALVMPLSELSPGPANEGQTLTVTAEVDRADLLFPPVVRYVAGESTGSVEVAPRPDTFGNATVRVLISDGQDTVEHRIAVEILPVNDAPSFVRGADVSIRQDAGPQAIAAWAKEIKAGPANESVQGLSFAVAPSEPAFFATLPAIDRDGTLRFAVAEGRSGSTTVLIRLIDDAGTANGGVNASDPVLLEISVLGVNQAPSFVKGPDVSVLEDSGSSRLVRWATYLRMGPASESGQRGIFLLSNSNPEWFEDAPALDAEGTLTFKPAPNAFGVATLSLRLRDDGGTANGGQDTSVEQVARIEIKPVNDAPTLDPIPGLTIDEDSGETGIELSNLGIGAPNEGQTLTVTAESGNQDLLPHPRIRTSVFGSSVLLLLPRTNAVGSSVVTVTVRDSGGVADGGQDSVTRTFVLRVLDVDDAPFIEPIPGTTIEQGKAAGPLPVAVSDPDTAITNLVVTVVSDNPVLVPATAITVAGRVPFQFLTVTPVPTQSGSAVLTLFVSDGSSTNQTSFKLTVTAVNRVPALSGLGDLTLIEDQVAAEFRFSVADPDTPASGLAVTAVSSDELLLPRAGVLVTRATGSAAETNWVLRLTPSPDRSGRARLTVTVSDGISSVSRDVAVEVKPVNDAPSFVAGPDVAVSEDSGAARLAGWARGLSKGPGDEAGQTLRFEVSNTSPALFETAPTVNADGTLAFAPTANAFGVATVSVVLVDDGGTADGGAERSLARTFTIRVDPVNDAPTLNTVNNLTRDEDSGPFTLTLSGLSSGAPNEAQQLTVTALSSNPALMPHPEVNYVSPAATGRLVLAPVTNAFGKVTVTVMVRDDGGTAGGGQDSTTRSFTVDFLPVNDPPVLGALLPQSTAENTSTAPIAIMVSDIDTPAERLRVTVTSSNLELVPNANLTLGGGGTNWTLRVLPSRDRTGETTISVVAGDGEASTTNRFVLVVSAVNQAPVLGVPGDQTTPEDVPLTVPLLVSDRETSEPRVRVESSNPILFPLANLGVSGTGTNRLLRVQPATNASGEGRLTVIVDDGRASVTNGFMVKVTPVNDAPGFTSGTNVVVREDAGLTRLPGWASRLSAGPADEAGQRLRFEVSTTSPALFSELPAISADGELRFAGAAQAFGEALVRVVLVDDGGRDHEGVDRSEAIEFRVSIRPVNDAPTLNPLNNITREEDSGVFTLVLSGITSGAANETQRLTVTAASSVPGILADPAVTYTSPAVNGRLILTPLPNAFGKTRVTVTVRDDGGVDAGGSDTVTQFFDLTIEPVNDAPTLAPLAARSAPENGSTGPIALTLGDIDTPLDQLKVGVTSSDPALVPAPGMVITGEGDSRLLVVTPAPGRTGTATLTVSVNDGSLSASQAFLLTVVSINEAPKIVAPAEVVTDEDTPVVVPVTVTDRENDAVQLAFEISDPQLVSPTNIVLNGLGADRSLRIVPNSNAYGTATLRLVARDGRLSSTHEIKLVVRPVDDPPLLAEILDQALNQDTTSAPIVLNLEDLDTPRADLRIRVAATDAGLLPESGLVVGGTPERRTLTLIPARGRSGPSEVTVRVSDAGTTVERSFRVVVSAPNTPPSILSQPQSRTVLVGTTVLFNVSAAGTAPLSYQWTLNGTHLPQATNAVLTLSAVATSATGRYAVSVRNSAGSVASEEAVLIVGQLGSKLWDVATGGEVRSSAALGNDGTVYVGSNDGKVYALSPFGQKRWEFATGAAVVSSPAVGEGVLYVGSQDGGLYALQTNGVLRWRFEAGSAIDSSPAIGRDGTVYVGDNNNRLHAVKSDGTARWSVAVGGLIYSSPAVGADGRVYFGAYDHRLYAVDAEGNVLWQFQTGGVVASSPAIGSDGTVYVGSADKRLYAVRPDGTRRWQYVSSAAISGSPVVGADGGVYFGTEDGRLVALTSEGTRRWEFVTGGPIYGAPVLGNDGTVYVAAFDSKLYAMNANGTRRWEFATGGPLYAAPALDRGGVLYLGSYDGKVYAIRGTTGLADTPWAMFHRDAAHTGRAPAAVEEPLRIRSVSRVAGLGVELGLSGPAGRAVVLEVSSDLVTWTRLEQMILTAGGSLFRDTRPAQDRLFYRLRRVD
ncbi:MAG: tandem-95 repeat protein [Verrucomicrobia bacterium]|nr:tandem-95 repeat protein [Verrucomicrobiota bacterium]